MNNAFDLTGKVAIVTGGAGGIGSAVVALMVERGACVAIADMDRDQSRRISSSLDPGRVFTVAVDLSDEDSIKSMVAEAVKHFGRLDILHNNAAALSPELVQKDGDLLSMETGVWDATFMVNCRGTMIVTREALPHLIQARGVIVNTVSNAAIRGHFLLAAYSASKAAVIQMTRSVAAAYGALGVRCNAVAPGVTMTPALKATFPPELQRLVLEETLRQQLGEPQDIAEVVAFLASDAARNITGEVIVADGGHNSHVPGLARIRNVMGK